MGTENNHPDSLGQVIEERERRQEIAAFERLVKKLSQPKKPSNEIANETAMEALIMEILLQEKIHEKEREEILRLFKQSAPEIKISKEEKGSILNTFKKDAPKISEKEQKSKKGGKGEKGEKIGKKGEKIATRQKAAKLRIVPQISKSGISSDILARFPVAYKNYMSLETSLRHAIYNLADMFGLNHTHVLGLIANESHFKKNAVSQVGARGLTQLMPGTLKGLRKFVSDGKIKNAGPEERFFALLRDNDDFMKIYNSGENAENLALGIAYLGYLTERYGAKALRIYNGGINFPNNHENMDYTRRVREFRKLFEGILQQNKTLLTASQ